VVKSAYSASVQYLSDAWLVAADQAVRAAADTAPATNLVVHQVITDGPSYQVRVARGNCSIVELSDASALDTADASFTQSLETATAVAGGASDAHQAFLLGHIRFVGNADVLIEQREAFEWLETVLAPVMAATTFADT